MPELKVGWSRFRVGRRGELKRVLETTAMLRTLLNLLIFLLLADACLADRGFLFQNPANGVSEPNQTAIIAYRDQTEILILATSVHSGATGRLVQFIPFPSEPKVFAANPNVTTVMEEMVRSRIIGGMMTRSEGGLEVISTQQIKAHSLTILRVQEMGALRDYVRKKLDRELGDREVELLQSYLDAGMNYFVLDQLDLDRNSEAVTPLAYEFQTRAIYYPLRTSNLADGKGVVQLLLLTDLTDGGYRAHEEFLYQSSSWFVESDHPLGLEGLRYSRSSPLGREHLADLDPSLPKLLPHGALSSLLTYRGPLKFAADPLVEGPRDSVEVTLEDSARFWEALRSNNTKTLQRLLQRDQAYARERTRNLETPLHVAAQTGSTDVLKLLVKNGAELDTRDRFGNRPIHLAAEAGQEESVRDLLEAGSELRHERDFQHPLKMTGDPAVIRLLAPQVDSRLLHDAAFAAAERGQLEGVKTFIEVGVPVHAIGGPGSFLHAAVKSGNIDFLTWLLGQGVNIESRGHRARRATPFALACREGNLEVAKLLLDAGAEATTRSNVGLVFGHTSAARSMTAADAAVVGGHPELLLFALEHGASLSDSIFDGKTPVHFAALSETPEVLKILIQRNLPLDVKDESGNTPIYYAKKFKKTENVEILRSAGALE